VKRWQNIRKVYGVVFVRRRLEDFGEFKVDAVKFFFASSSVPGTNDDSQDGFSR
jgi:hypothetical protein